MREVRFSVEGVARCLGYVRAGAPKGWQMKRVREIQDVYCVSGRWLCRAALGVLLLSCTHAVQPVEGSIAWYGEKGLWEAAAGATTTIDFETDTWYTAIYADEYIFQGLQLDYSSPPAEAVWVRFDETWGARGPLLHDGGGLSSSAGATLAFRFLQPVNAFGTVGLSEVTQSQFFAFYLEGVLVGYTNRPIGGGGGQGQDPFNGVVTDFYFDRVVTSDVSLDDIYFSSIVVPAPGVLPLLGVGAAIALRGRRRGRE